MNPPLFTIRIEPSLIVNGRIGTDVSEMTLDNGRTKLRVAGPPEMVMSCADHYFNTTNETGATLKTYRAKAAEQEDAILRIFQDIGIASPSQIHKAMNTSAPLTSIRRAMTNLTTAGKLAKMDHKVQGAYGRKEHAWKIVNVD